MLPTDAKERKNIPVYSGFIVYFRDAIAEVAKVSKRGNDQHNPGKPLHWDRSKSGDELDALTRHLIDGSEPGRTLDEQIEDAAARSWRSMADLQKLCEQRDQNSDSQKSAEPISVDGETGPKLSGKERYDALLKAAEAADQERHDAAVVSKREQREYVDSLNKSWTGDAK